MGRVFSVIIVLAFVVAACSSNSADVASVPELPEVEAEAVTLALDESTNPVVLNVWASWCTPCRSEAPLLDRAAGEFAGTVDFVGVNVRDGMDDARGFIAEFFPEADITHVYDRPGDVPVALGGTVGVPQTFFYAAGGSIDHPNSLI